MAKLFRFGITLRILVIPRSLSGLFFLILGMAPMDIPTSYLGSSMFIAKIEKGFISKSKIKRLVWKRYIDDVFCLWDTTEENIEKLCKGQTTTTIQSNLRLKPPNHP